MAALRKIPELQGALAINLRTGNGYSEIEIIRMFEKVNGQPICEQYSSKRPGDVAECFADPGRAQTLLGGRAEQTLQAMCQDSWRWHTKNPSGYKREAAIEHLSSLAED